MESRSVWQGRQQSLDFSTELFRHLTLPCWLWSKKTKKQKTKTWGGYIEFKTKRNKKNCQLLWNLTNGGQKASFHSTVPYKLKRTLILSWLTLFYCLHSCFRLCRLLCHCALCALFLYLYSFCLCHSLLFSPLSLSPLTISHPLHPLALVSPPPPPRPPPPPSHLHFDLPLAVLFCFTRK